MKVYPLPGMCEQREGGKPLKWQCSEKDQLRGRQTLGVELKGGSGGFCSWGKVHNASTCIDVTQTDMVPAVRRQSSLPCRKRTGRVTVLGLAGDHYKGLAVALILLLHSYDSLSCLERVFTPYARWPSPSSELEFCRDPRRGLKCAWFI